MPKIPALPPMTSVDTADELPIEDVSAGTTKYITLTKLKEWFQSLTAWITYAMVATNTLRSTNIDWAASTGKVWWEELGRTTLGANGDTISVTGLAARRFLKASGFIRNSGTITFGFRFNNDSGSNYSWRYIVDGAFGSGVTQSRIGDAVNDTVHIGYEITVTNQANGLKEGRLSLTAHTGTVGTAAHAAEFYFSWVNSTDAISRIDIINQGSGDYLAGSDIVVRGHD